MINNKFKYKITIEYLGTGFCGWQRQPHSLSIQELLEKAIYKFSKELVSLTAAGRTDAGVHAYGQVASFEISKTYDPYLMMQSINFFCRPYAVGVIKCELVDLNFDARFSAKKRHYVYKILNRKSANIINYGLQCWIRDYLDIDLMNQGAKYLIGNHDFTSFRATRCQSSSPVKTIDDINIIRDGENIEIYVSAISFLHHMVRNIAGSLIEVGRNRLSAQEIKDILEAKKRSSAAPTAPAEGLYFLKVEY